MKKILLLTIVFGSVFCSAQDLKRSDFEIKPWYSNVAIDSIFQMDSIQLSRLISSSNKADIIDVFVLLDFYKNQKIATVTIYRKDIYINEVKHDWCGFSKTNMFKWKINKERQTVRFFNDHNSIEFSVSEGSEEVIWSNESNTKPIEIKGNILTLYLERVSNEKRI